MAETTTKATPKKTAAKVADTAQPAIKKAPAPKKAPVAKAVAATTETVATEAAKVAAPAEPKQKAKDVAAKPIKATASSAKSASLTDEQRYRMIAEAAYYRAESNNFLSDPLRDWIDAEKDISALLNNGK